MSPVASISDNHWQCASGADRLVRANRRSALAAALIALSFLCLPLIQALGASASGVQNIDDEGVQTIPDDPYSESLSKFTGRDWDWASYADEDGLVSVIVSNPVSPSLGTASEFLSILRAHETVEYSAAFDGFSAKVELETIEYYSHNGGDGVGIYPDLPVNATQSESLLQIGAEQVWSMTDTDGAKVKGSGIVVAVIDTGIDYTHPDLAGNYIGGYDFFNKDSNPMDDNGHGTHVAGIIAANGPNMSGVAPEAKLLAYKCLGADGSGAMSNVILGIDAALDPNGDGEFSDRADVISMSLGGAGEPTDPICQAVENAVAQGIVVVVAAGNSGPGMGTVASPGIAPHAITVGAINGTGSLATFSSRGSPNSLLIKPEISAPGVNILSTVPRFGTKHSSPTGYASLSGTSMATPFVSGSVALLLQMHSGWTPAMVKSALISCANPLNESLWQAGAGGLWIPTAISQRLFADQPLISYGLASDYDKTSNVSFSGMSITLAASSLDRFSMSANASRDLVYWSNISSVTPTSVSVVVQSEIVLSLNAVQQSAPEGYYEGEVRLSGSSYSLRIPFGYAVLSTLTVRVWDTSGKEVFDPYGGVWIWNTPEANIAIGVRGDYFPAPPATFMLPSGNYTVHAAGHQLVYTYANPYLLSGTISLGRMQVREINLEMNYSRRMVVDLQTGDGYPIYVKDFRMYCRYTGAHNVSFHLTGSDYSIKGESVFSRLKDSITVFVNDTSDTVGISVAGFSYTPDMWDFMKKNWQHWYEFADDNSHDFFMESTADLQYLLAWEFPGVDSMSSTSLSINPATVSTYHTKYDIPGYLENVWADWGTHLAIGGDSTFYMRRDTDTSLNPFFTGMTRTTYVQGVWSEPYFYGNLFEGYFVRPFYTPDYSHANRAATVSEIYLPDRNYLIPINSVSVTERLGMGPYYPSVRTANTNDSLVMFHPLLRDQSGAEVGGMYVPGMRLYRNGGLVGVYQLSEYLARTNAERVVDLTADGSYTADISYAPTPQICNDVNIWLHFVVPSTDVNPPSITGLQMSQRFVPGESVPIQISAQDDMSLGSVQLLWRAGAATSWQSLTVTQAGQGLYSSAIQTSASDQTIDLDLKVFDTAGNYIEYFAGNASMKQIPVSFAIVSDRTDIGYRYGDAFVILTGHLTDASGSPLHESAAVPLELTLNGRKLGIVLDEFDSTSTHVHDGTIRFEWHFNPANIFTGPDQSATIDVWFDLGIYEPIHKTIALNSIYYYNPAPVITLNSPSNGSIIPAGRLIDLDVSDDGAVTAQMRLDGQSAVQLQSPWDVNTNQWSDGDHTIEITATDDQMVESWESYYFHVDKYDPIVRITSPELNNIIPKNWTLTAVVSDEHLGQVNYSLDNSTPLPLASPYSIDMTGWPVGDHSVSIVATDLAGHIASATVYFTITERSIASNPVSPHNGDVIRSGVPLVFAVFSMGVYQSSWEEFGVWRPLGAATSIATAGWTEGLHVITINSTDSLGGWCEIEFSVIIDDTDPVVTLDSPDNNSFVSPDDIIALSVIDANFRSAIWNLWGRNQTTVNPSISVNLSGSPGDGYFTLDVWATDKAGNTGVETFIFAMDSGVPSLSCSGTAPGAAVLPTQVLTVDATDPFLSSVSLRIDLGATVSIQTPYLLNCSSLSLDWHTLYIEAYDYSGKSSNASVSFYVDGTAPVIVPTFPASGRSNTPLVLEARITDDYAVSRAELHYQAKDGEFLDVLLNANGSIFSATLSGNALWDGMQAFVVAYDVVGHISESEHVSLRIMAGTDDSDSPPGTGGDWLSGLTSGSSLIGLLGLGVVISSIAIYFVFFAGRRSHHDRKHSDRSGKAYNVRSQTAPPTQPPSVLVWPAPSTLRDRSSIDRSTVASASIPSRVPPVERVENEPTRLLDAIPTVKLSLPSDDAAALTDDIDYGDLIERELLLPGLKQSVFSKESDDRLEEVDKRLDELEQILARNQKKLLE